jgi:hypothetical protein
MIRVDLTAKGVSTSRRLGVLADALLASRSDRVMLSFGANASDPRVTSTVAKWLERNDQLVRVRVKAFALVAPSFWVRLQWRLFFLLSQPIVRSTVHGTEEKAARWLEQAN